MEEKIDLMNIFWYCLKRWKFIIAMGVLGLIVAGAYSVKTQKSAQQQDTNYDNEALQQEYDVAKEEYDGIQEWMDASEDIIDKRTEYYHDSLKMQIDWQNEYTRTDSVEVTGTEKDSINQDMVVYGQSEEFYKKILEESGIDTETEYLRELVRISCEQCVQIQTIAADENTCENISEVATELLLQVAQESAEEHNRLSEENGYNIASGYLPAIVNLVQGNVECRVDRVLYSEQINVFNSANYINVINFENNKKQYESRLGDLQTAMDSVQAKMNYQPVIQQTGGKITILVFSAIGGVGLAVFAICLLLASYLLTAKVVNPNDVVRICGNNIIGQYLLGKKSKSKLTNWVEKQERKGINDVTEEAFAKSCAILLQGRLDAENKNSLMFIDENNNDISKQIIEAIDKKYTVNTCEKIVYEPDAVQALRHADAIVYVVYREKTKKAQLYRNIKFIKDNNMECFGTILL